MIEATDLASYVGRVTKTPGYIPVTETARTRGIAMSEVVLFAHLRAYVGKVPKEYGTRPGREA